MQGTKCYYLLLLYLFTISFSCSSPTQPPTKIPPTVPDSTTQNFTFQTYEFSDGYGSSYLNDVWIFSENNIWAVGWISPDDTANDAFHVGNPNIVIWNGVKWRVPLYSGTSSGMYGIWAIDSSHIYFADGGVVKYDILYGYKREDVSKLGFNNGQGVHKLWGSSENNIWGVGPWGTIVHYDGNEWSKIDFDQGWRFDAITGSEKTGIAYACATDQSFNTAIVELKNNSANIIYNSANTAEHLTSFSIKLLNDEELLLGLNRIWKYNLNTKQATLQYTLPSGYAVVNIAIYSEIDVYYFVDQYGPGEELLHYNGKQFKEINFSNRNSVIYGGAYAIKDLAILTGFSNNKAYLVEVKRR